jgi:pSer/pThr/pTyr-binding forkhead associated (FHA) protein
VWAVLSAVQSDARYELRYNRTLVGRAKENDIVITDPSISRRHALLWREVGRCWIADFSSSNGTFVNGDPVFEVFEVKNSDLILFGEAAFDLEIT